MRRAELFFRGAPIGLLAGWVVVVAQNTVGSVWWSARSGSLVGGHVATWYMLLGLALAVSFIPFRSVNGSRGLFVAGFVLAFREGTWNFLAFMRDPGFWLRNMLFSVDVAQFFAVLLFVVFAAWKRGLLDVFDRWYLYCGLLGYCLLMAVWWFVGFPVTVYGGVTEFFYSFGVNVVELATWAYLIVMCLLSYLTKWRYSSIRPTVSVGASVV